MKGQKAKKCPQSDLALEGTDGHVRDFAYLGRAKRDTKHVKDRFCHGLCNIAREKAERKR